MAHNESTSGSDVAVPTWLGGLADEALHALSLGNVFMFHKLLRVQAEAVRWARFFSNVHFSTPAQTETTIPEKKQRCHTTIRTNLYGQLDKFSLIQPLGMIPPRSSLTLWDVLMTIKSSFESRLTLVGCWQHMLGNGGEASWLMRMMAI